MDIHLESRVTKLLAEDLDSDGLPEILMSSEDGKLTAFQADGKKRFEASAGGEVDNLILVDAERDGQTEYLAVTTEGELTVWSSDGERLFEPDTVDRDDLETADLDGDGALEILFVRRIGQRTQPQRFELVGMRFDGEALFALKLNSLSSIDSDWIADLDGDGKLEIVFLEDMGAQVRTIGSDGIERFKVSSESRIRSLAVRDLDADHRGEVLLLEEVKGFGEPRAQVRVLGGDGKERFKTEVSAVGEDLVGLGRSTRNRIQTADLDGDGRLEVLVDYPGLRLTALASDGSRRFEMERPESTGWGDSILGSVDLDGDRKLETLLGQGKNLRVLESSGALRFEIEAGLVYGSGLRRESLSVADLDGDGKLEILAENRLEGKLLALAPDGVPRFEAPLRGALSALAVVDLEGDGALEVVAGTDRDDLLILEANGSLRSRTGIVGPLREIETGQFAGDARLEIAAISGGEGALLFDGRGKLLARINADFRISMHQAADLDGDGRLELLVVAGRDSNHVFAADFGDTATFDVAASRFWVPPADLDGDARPEIVASYATDRIGGFRGDGALASEAVTESRLVACATADLDGDSRHEIIAGTDSGEVLAFPTGGAQRIVLQEKGPVNQLLPSDLDGDGRHELLARIGDSRLLAVSGDGKALWESAAPGEKATIELLDARDLDRDGRPEVILRTSVPSLLVLDATGSLRLESKLPGHAERLETANLGPDRNRALVVACGSQILGIGTDGTKVFEFEAGRDLRYHGLCLADLDLDGRDEVVFVGPEETGGSQSSPSRSVAAKVRMAGFSSEAKRLFEMEAAGGGFLGAADLDGDRVLEVLFTEESTALRTYRARAVGLDLKERFRAELSHEAKVILAADLDADGNPEVVVGTAIGVVVLGGGGTRTFDLELGIEIEAMSVADIDRDGQGEILAGTRKGVVVIGSDGKTRLQIDARSVRAVGSADLDGDGKLEIIARTTYEVLTFAADGAARAKILGSGVIFDCVTLDLDRDGKSEIAAVNATTRTGESGTLAVFSGDGGKRWEAPFQGRAGALAGADLDGDSRAELLVAAGNRLLAFEADGKPRFTSEVPSQIETMETMDLDGDGKLEVLLCAARRKIHVLAANGAKRFTIEDEELSDKAVGFWALKPEGSGGRRLLVLSNSAFADVLEFSGDGVKLGERMRFPGSRAVFCDLDRDGQPEVIMAESVRENRSRLAAVDRAGKRVLEATIPTGDRVRPTQAVMTDVDGDRRAEILLAIDRGHGEDPPAELLLLNPDGTPRFVARTQGEASSLQAVDLDGDARPEICLGEQLYEPIANGWRSAGTRLALLDSGGNTLFAKDGPLGFPHAGDVDGDAKQDLLIFTMDRLLALGADGRERCFLKLEKPVWSYQSTFADLDGDGRQEAVLVDWLRAGRYRVTAASLPEGKRWDAVVEGGVLSRSGLATADLDSDGKREVLLTLEGGPFHADRLVALTLDGKRAFEALFEGQIQEISTADLDQDKRLEILVQEAFPTAAEDRIAILRCDGTLQGRAQAGGKIAGYAPVEKKDATGTAVLVVTAGGAILAFTAEGKKTVESSWRPSGASPRFVDLDADGSPEVFLLSRDRIFRSSRDTSSLLRPAERTILGLRPDGARVFEAKVAGTQVGDILASDLDGDRWPEIIVSSAIIGRLPGSKDKLVVFSHDGAQLLDLPVSGRIDDLRAADVDADGRPELVFLLQPESAPRCKLLVGVKSTGEKLFEQKVAADSSLREIVDLRGAGRPQILLSGSCLTLCLPAIGSASGDRKIAGRQAFLEALSAAERGDEKLAEKGFRKAGLSWVSSGEAGLRDLLLRCLEAQSPAATKAGRSLEDRLPEESLVDAFLDLATSERSDQALELWRRGRQAMKEGFEVSSILANVLLDMVRSGYPSPALKELALELAEVLSKAPPALGHTAIARAYLWSGRLAEARRILEVMPVRVIGQVDTERAELEQEMKVQEIRQALERSPGDPALLLSLAEALLPELDTRAGSGWGRYNSPVKEAQLSQVMAPLLEGLELDPKGARGREVLAKIPALLQKLQIRFPGISYESVERHCLQDPQLLRSFAEVEVHYGHFKEATLSLEQALGLPGVDDAVPGLLETCRKGLLPDLVSYASVDAALIVEEALVPEGARWRFFRGTREPTPGLEWTAPEFEDGSWEEGPSGFGFGDDDDATVLAEMRGSYTTVYIRHRFDVPQLGPSTSLTLSVRADDGFVAYLNGREVGRDRAGKEVDRVHFDGVA